MLSFKARHSTQVLPTFSVIRRSFTSFDTVTIVLHDSDKDMCHDINTHYIFFSDTQCTTRPNCTVLSVPVIGDSLGKVFCAAEYLKSLEKKPRCIIAYEDANKLVKLTRGNPCNNLLFSNNSSMRDTLVHTEYNHEILTNVFDITPAPTGRIESMTTNFKLDWNSFETLFLGPAQSIYKLLNFGKSFDPNWMRWTQGGLDKPIGQLYSDFQEGAVGFVKGGSQSQSGIETGFMTCLAPVLSNLGTDYEVIRYKRDGGLDHRGIALQRFRETEVIKLKDIVNSTSICNVIGEGNKYGIVTDTNDVGGVIQVGLKVKSLGHRPIIIVVTKDCCKGKLKVNALRVLAKHTLLCCTHRDVRSRLMKHGLRTPVMVPILKQIKFSVSNTSSGTINTNIYSEKARNRKLDEYKVAYTSTRNDIWDKVLGTHLASLLRLELDFTLWLIFFAIEQVGQSIPFMAISKGNLDRQAVFKHMHNRSWDFDLCKVGSIYQVVFSLQGARKILDLVRTRNGTHISCLRWEFLIALFDAKSEMDIVY